MSGQRRHYSSLVSKAKSFTSQPHTKNEKSAMADRDELLDYPMDGMGVVSLLALERALCRDEVGKHL